MNTNIVASSPTTTPVKTMLPFAPASHRVQRAFRKTFTTSAQFSPLRSATSARSVNFIDFNHFIFRNPLISRVCTTLHVNTIFFSPGRSPYKVSKGVLDGCVPCVTPGYEIVPRIKTPLYRSFLLCTAKQDIFSPICIRAVSSHIKYLHFPFCVFRVFRC